jgi:hypothetical protein
MSVKKRRMTMNRAITILRESGWRVDVDENKRRILLTEPLADVNWLHILRREDVPEVKSRSGSVEDTVFSECPKTP